MKTLLLAALMITATAHAADELCAPDLQAKREKSFPSSENMNFFIRPAGKNAVTFTDYNGNRQMDLETGKITEIPGSVDPVYSPDGVFMATPMGISVDGKTKQSKLLNVALKDWSEVEKKFKYKIENDIVYEKRGDAEWIGSSETLDQIRGRGESYLAQQMTMFYKDPSTGEQKQWVDEKITGNYQSIGVLHVSANENRYRMLMVSGTDIVTKDYNVERGDHLSFQESSPQKLACSGMAANQLVTPMINRDGSEFAAYDSLGEVTTVYRINSSTGKCDVTETFPAQLGKPDFSPDGTKLAFHLDEGARGKPISAQGWLPIFNRPENFNKIGAYVYDRKSKMLSIIDDGANHNSYFPVFIDNDHVAFATSTREEDPKFTIDVVKLSEPSGCRDCVSDEKNRYKVLFLGYLYNKRCGSADFNLRGFLSGFAHLNRRSCLKMISAYNDPQMDEQKKLAVEMNRQTNIDRPKGGNGWDKWDKLTLEDLKPVTRRDLTKICENFESPAQVSPDTANPNSVQ